MRSHGKSPPLVRIFKHLTKRGLAPSPNRAGFCETQPPGACPLFVWRVNEWLTTPSELFARDDYCQLP